MVESRYEGGSMPVFHEGEPISQAVVDDFTVTHPRVTEFATAYKQATEEEKTELLAVLTLPITPNIFLCLTDPIYRSFYGIDNNLYESDSKYKDRINDLLNEQVI